MTPPVPYSRNEDLLDVVDDLFAHHHNAQLYTELY